MMLALLLLIFNGCFHTDTTANPVCYTGKFYQVKKIVDGDTFWVDDGSEKGLKIRLIGIDAPEVRNAGKKRKEFFGQEATDYMNKLIEGKLIRLEYDVARYDRYHRILAYAFLADGTFVNAKMISEGYAVVMTIPPNVKYADIFLALQKKAREQKKGMWRQITQW